VDVCVFYRCDPSLQRLAREPVVSFSNFCHLTVDDLWQGENDPYAAAREAGIHRVIKSPRNITTSTIISRILANHEAYKVLNGCLLGNDFGHFFFLLQEIGLWMTVALEEVYFPEAFLWWFCCGLQKRNEKKVKSEEQYYQSKTYVNGD
jgi:hypothetical protein